MRDDLKFGTCNPFDFSSINNSCDLDFLGIRKFYLCSKIQNESFFAKIGFKLFMASYFMHKSIIMLCLKYIYFYGRV
jgi:hypothetical protein